MSRSAGTYRIASTAAPGAAPRAEAAYRVFRPDGPGPHPAVVFLSGCSGFGPPDGALRKSYERRAEQLRGLGFVVVWADYLGRRNLTSCAGGGVTPLEAGRDGVAAAAWLRSQPDVDPKRIAVMGWSFGGGAVFAALGSHRADELVFTRAVAYYPYCAGLGPWSTRIPVLVLRGTSDDVAPPRSCDAVLGSGPAAADVKIVEYADALHGFDLSELPPRTQYQFGSLGHHPKAAAAAWDEVQRFLRPGGGAAMR